MRDLTPNMKLVLATPQTQNTTTKPILVMSFPRQDLHAFINLGRCKSACQRYEILQLQMSDHATPSARTAKYSHWRFWGGFRCGVEVGSRGNQEVGDVRCRCKDMET